MKRTAHILLVVIFALLQGVSPFAHAHIGGGHDDQHLHVHEIQQQLENASKLSICAVEAPDSRAIGMSQGKQRHTLQFVFDHPMIHGDYTSLPTQTTSDTEFQPAADHLPRLFLLFRKQYPQAPPTLG